MVELVKMMNDNISLQPEEIVIKYYKLLYNGDLNNVKKLMTETSYYMALESLGIKLSFKDPIFKNKLENMEDDKRALKDVEERLSIDLLSRGLAPKINIHKLEENGSLRRTVHYTEDDKIKNLYFSKEKKGWKINYYAGRKVD